MIARLEDLRGKGIGLGYLLELQTQKMPAFEQAFFKVYLVDSVGRMSEQPIFAGVHSHGREALGIKGWIDGDYYEVISMPGVGELNLTKNGLAFKLFTLLGSLVPRGGSFMVAYTMFFGEGEAHRETRQGLDAGFPPPTTPIGYMLFNAGCLAFKDWYFSEGGREGPEKIMGLKPLTQGHARLMTDRLISELEAFLRAPSSWGEIHERARLRAIKVLEKLKEGLMPNPASFS